jgi:hypothetical protein
MWTGNKERKKNAGRYKERKRGRKESERYLTNK